MKITILGTAAAEGVPSLFCNCHLCIKSRKAGGRNIRSRSSILIDEVLKIDWPPDSFHHSIVHNMNTAKLKFLLITHGHHDHFAHQDLLYLKSGFATRDELPNLQLYGTKDVINLFPKIKNIALNHNYIIPFEKYDIGEYKITTLKAMHGGGTNPLNYIIHKNGKSLLYNCDTGYYEDETWRFLASTGIKLDMVISECTGGPDRVDYKHHMGLPNVCEFRKKTEEIGITDSGTDWILTHFTHNNGTTYNEMVNIAEKENFEVAYDGMEVNL
jgi:phosphoribosyl 1,2-cyclic phosphate phosphodiesterase